MKTLLPPSAHTRPERHYFGTLALIALTAGVLADSAPAPLEGGESQIGVSISGRIDLLE